MTKFTLILLLLLSSTAALTAEIDSRRFERLEQWIQNETAGLSPGVAVGIVQDGEVVYETYAGYANLEHQTKVGPKTRFNIASNAKQFTAICVLELANEGVLDLDLDVRKYLPELYPDSPQVITVANLIDHTSGIRDVHALWSLQGRTWWKEFLDNSDALQLLTAQKDLNFEPGSDFLYSNSNYLLLAEIVERATGRPFHERAKALFERAEMHHTEFLTNSMAVIPDRASPYGNWSGWKCYPTITSLHGDGALFTTLGDQLAWEVVVQNPESHGFDGDLISTSQDRLPQSFADEYGFGVTFHSYKGVDCISHEGNTGAYNATFLRFPSERLAVVVMSNNGSLSTYVLARAYADVMLGEEKLAETAYPSRPESIGPKPLTDDIVGVYEMADQSIASVTSRRGRIYLEVDSQDVVRLAHERGNLYRHAKARDQKVSFSVDEQKAPVLTIYRSGLAPNVGSRLSTEPIEKGYSKSIEGRYRNAETGAEFVLRHRADEAYDVIKNGRPRTGTLLVRDRLKERNTTIRIDRGANGRVQGLQVDGDRIRNVAFEKISQ